MGELYQKPDSTRKGPGVGSTESMSSVSSEGGTPVEEVRPLCRCERPVPVGVSDPGRERESLSTRVETDQHSNLLRHGTLDETLDAVVRDLIKKREMFGFFFLSTLCLFSFSTHPVTSGLGCTTPHLRHRLLDGQWTSLRDRKDHRRDPERPGPEMDR